MKNPYDKWPQQIQCARDDLRQIRKLLEQLNSVNPSDEITEALERQERIKKIFFFAADMIPPPPKLEELEDELANLQVGEDPSPTVSPFLPETPEATRPTEVDEPPSTGLRVTSKWIAEEKDRVIDIPDLDEYRRAGLLYDHPEAKEYYEEVQNNIVEPTVKADGKTPHLNRVTVKCKLCVKLFEEGKINKAPQPYQLNAPPSQYWVDNSLNQCSLTAHIIHKHKDLFKEAKKCGCNMGGRHTNERGYTSFYVFRQHIRGNQHDNLHKQARDAQAHSRQIKYLSKLCCTENL